MHLVGKNSFVVMYAIRKACAHCTRDIDWDFEYRDLPERKLEWKIIWDRVGILFRSFLRIWNILNNLRIYVYKFH